MKLTDRELLLIKRGIVTISSQLKIRGVDKQEYENLFIKILDEQERRKKEIDKF